MQKLESWVNIDSFVVLHSLKAEHCGLAEPLAKAGGFEKDREWPFSLPMAKCSTLLPGIELSRFSPPEQENVLKGQGGSQGHD